MKTQGMNIDIFSKKILQELTDCFYLVYSNVDGNGKMWKAQKYYLPNGVITNQQK